MLADYLLFCAVLVVYGTYCCHLIKRRGYRLTAVDYIVFDLSGIVLFTVLIAFVGLFTGRFF